MRLVLFVLFIFISGKQVYAACGGNTRTWQADAGSSNWNSNNNWNPRNRPNSAGENAVIVSDWYNPTYPGNNYTLGCLEISSGSMTVGAGNRVIIVGDYFRNLNSNSLVVPGGSTWEVRMQGTGDQTYENVDSIPRLRINNSNTVDITEQSTITNRFQIIDGSGVVNIEKGMVIEATAANVTIPTTASVVVKAGAILTVKRNLTINGVLRVEAGGKLIIGNGRTLTVAAGGLIHLDGGAGNIAQIDADNGGRFTFNVTGSINARYFSIARAETAGVNISGSIQDMSDGEFHFIQTNGYAVTLGASTTVPGTLNSLGFFDEGAAGTQRNFNASVYTGSNFLVGNYSGLGGAINENDPSGKVDWGSEAEAALQVTDSSAVGVPAATTAAGTSDTHLSTLGFSMTGTASTASDITSITFTIGGVNTAGDVTDLNVYNDTNGNCIYDSGTDIQIGSSITPTGFPANATLSIGGGVLSVVDTTLSCIHILGSINATAADGNTISIKIASSEDVANSENYDWSVGGAPPLESGTTMITGVSQLVWHGGYGNPGTGGIFNQTNQWTPTGSPSSVLDCQIGSGYSYPYFPDTTERACQNINLQSSGRLSWKNRTTVFSAYGSLTIGSSYNFDQATNGTIAFKGSSNQTITSDTTFPGDVLASNTGNAVLLNSDWTIGGDLTVTSGDFQISPGNNLTVLGNINVNGGNLTIAPGATLTMANGTSITIGAAGTLVLAGNSSQNAQITSTDTGSSYSITINGTIEANYYSLSRLGTTGLTINSGASIDATNHLQNGTFSYPVNNNSDLLVLNRKIPGNSLDQMTFTSDGSTATNTIAIKTNTGAGTLTITNYSGDRTGDTYSDDPTYLVDWATATNTIKISEQAGAPANVNQGETYILGSVAFEQTQAGSFNDTDITDLTVSLVGTGDAGDIAGLRAYYDASCSESGGVLLGSASFSGSPARATFSSLTGAVVESHATTPPSRCIYFEIDVDSLATSGQTIGLEVDNSTHVTNSEGYSFNGTYAPPVTMGNPALIIGNTTIWTGNNSTAWNNAGNWTSGIPTSSINCIINSATRDPLITTAAVCKSLTNGNGIITINAGGSLDIYGSFESTGTFNQNSRVLTIRDNGATTTTQTVKCTSTLDSLAFNKTAGGTVQFVAGSLTITNTLNMGASNIFDLQLLSNSTVSLSGGLNVNGATVDLQASSHLRIGASQSITISGGTFKTTAANQAYPQNTSSMALIDAVSGRYAFSATSGTVTLSGFLFDDLDDNGMSFSGSTNLTAMDGGQLRSLSTNYSSMSTLKFNNSGTLPSSISNIGWNWDSVPANTEAYLIASSGGCGSRTVTFLDWFGNWIDDTPTFDVDAKISNSSCNIVFGGAVTPVALTSFNAQGFNEAILLTWTTGMEVNHTGFNVYKSSDPSSGFYQINKTIIKNSILNTNMHGDYVFHDLTGINGEIAYYLLEDISSDGKRKWHGPKSAQALAANGDLPLVEDDVIFASTSVSPPPEGGGEPEDSSTPSERRQISENVAILSETSKGMRIEVIIPDYTLIDSDQVGFKSIVMEGYSKTSVPGEAELPLKTLLITIPKSSSASFVIHSSIETAPVGARIVPVDGSRLEGNNIIPEPAFSDSYYAKTEYFPASNIDLGELSFENGKSILPITIFPIVYNPSSDQIIASQKIVIDVFFDGATDWSGGEANFTPWELSGGLKIAVKVSGVYELAFDDLLSSGLEASIAGAHIADLKLYLRDSEMPIEVISDDEFFNNGDKIRFYGRSIDSHYSNYTHFLLIDDNGSGDGLRFDVVDGTPSAEVVNNAIGFEKILHFEENNNAYFREPLGEDYDHIFWQGFYAPAASDGVDFFTYDVDLSDIATSEGVEVSALLKGSKAAGTSSLRHHVSLWINGVETDQNAIFESTHPYLATFKVAAGLLAPGKNRIQFQAKGTYTENKYDLIDLDYFKVRYIKDWYVDSDYADVRINSNDTESYLLNFSNNDITLYDITDFKNAKKISNANVEAQDGHFNVSFYHNGARRIIATSEYKSPDYVTVNGGSDYGLTNHQAEILYIGSRELLDAVLPLANFRKEQGYNYKLIDLDDIYNEFGKGDLSPEAIKVFIKHAKENWKSPNPEYVVLLGDGTYDPRGYLGNTPKNSFPLKLLEGKFYDYGSDNWFVTNEDSDIPIMSIGRIPGNSPDEILNYALKVIAYETGDLSPNNETAKNFEIVVDKSEDGEKFEQKAKDLEKFLEKSLDKLSITSNYRQSSTDIVVKEKIHNSFDAGRSIVHYIGHGAEDMWAGYDVFTNSDVVNMNNETLPLVVAMNCLNTYFYFESESDKGLGEKMVLKENGGAIAFWGSTSFTSPSAQTPYQDAFYRYVFQDGLSLGEAIKKSKISAGTTGDSEVLKSWTLLGDPVLNLRTPKKPSTVSNKKKKSGGAGGGCSAIASDSEYQIPWYTWLLDYLFLIMFVLGFRQATIALFRKKQFR